MRGLPFVDLARVYLAGHSVGGTQALFGAMASRDIRDAASFSGSPDHFAWLQGSVFGKIAPFDTGDFNEVEIRSPLAYARSFKGAGAALFWDRRSILPLAHLQLVAVAVVGLDVDSQEFPGEYSWNFEDSPTSIGTGTVIGMPFTPRPQKFRCRSEHTLHCTPQLHWPQYGHGTGPCMDTAT